MFGHDRNAQGLYPSRPPNVSRDIHDRRGRLQQGFGSCDQSVRGRLMNIQAVCSVVRYPGNNLASTRMRSPVKRRRTKRIVPIIVIGAQRR